MAGLQLQEKYTMHKYTSMYLEQLNSLNYFFERIPNFFGLRDFEPFEVHQKIHQSLL